MKVSSIIPTLGNFALRKIKIQCWCGRYGEYDRERAAIKYGDDFTLNQFITMVAKCPKKKCGAGCDDLIYMHADLKEVRKEWDR